MKSLNLRATFVCFILCSFWHNRSIHAQDIQYLVELPRMEESTFGNEAFFISDVIDIRSNAMYIGFVRTGAFNHTKQANLSGGIIPEFKYNFNKLCSGGDAKNKTPFVVGLKEISIGEKPGAFQELGWVELELVFYQRTGDSWCEQYSSKVRLEFKSLDVTSMQGEQINQALIQSLYNLKQVGLNMPCVKVASPFIKTEIQKNTDLNEDDFVAPAQPPIISKSKERDEHQKKTSLLRIYGSWGYSKLIMDTNGQTPFEKEVNDNLSTGHYYQFELQYFPHKKWGFGLTANLFTSSIYYPNVVYEDTTGHQFVSKLDDNLSINSYLISVGRMFSFAHEKHSVYLGYSLGINRYKEHGFIGQPFSLNGQSGCSRFTFRYQARVSPGIGVGLNASYGGGLITSLSGNIAGTPVNLKFDPSNALGTQHWDVGVVFTYDL
jgi:hypothetical protein